MQNKIWLHFDDKMTENTLKLFFIKIKKM